MQRLAPSERSTTGSLASTLLIVAGVLAVGALTLLGAPFEVWGAVLVGVGIMVISLPVLARQARREGDQRLLALLTLALVVKLIGAVVRHYVAFSVYAGIADASGYHGWGIRLAHSFWAGDFRTGLESLSDTDFIRFLTGLVYTVIGPNRLAGFLVFSWLGFWGLFLFYRAFAVAVPEGRARGYAKLLFFLPSLVYWPSSIGKESWMTLALGVVAFGAARILTGRTWTGLVVAGIGLWLAGLVRPHVAGIAALALAVGFLFRRPRVELRQLAGLAKAASVVVLAVLALVLVRRTDQFLRRADFRLDRGVSTVLSEVSERTGQGGSEFAPSIVDSPLRAPVAAVTVTFRPLLHEAHNPQSLVTAIEGTFLLALSLARVRWMLGALGSVRRRPYLAFAIAYAALFIVAFSAVANFGLLARERAQLLPLYLVLVSIPPRNDDDATRDH